MQIVKWRQWSLSVKLTVSITLLVVVVAIGVTALSIQREQQNFQTELQQQADLVVNTLIAAQSNALFNLDAVLLQRITGGLGTYQVVTFGRVYDADGRVVADAYDPNAVFATAADPLGKRLVASDTTVFDWQADQLVAGKAVVVGRQRLGAISVGLSTAPLQVKMAAVRDQGLLVALVAAVIGAGLALLLSRSITAPLYQLTGAVDRITAGDLSQRISVSSGDELATLAGAFNKMSAQLQDNIAELRKARDEALAASRLAQENSRLKSEFLSTMSHELRTPLNAIEGFTSIMLGGMGVELNPKARGMLERVSSNSKRLLQLINDFLDLSRIESGRLELVSAPMSPAKLVENWKSQMSVLAEQKHIAFEVTVDPQLPVEIWGDEEAISKITINLLGNAFKFTHQGKVSLELRWHTDTWSIAVGDTGIGIPPHARDYIFEEFRQVDGSSKREYGGTGLGLAIVQKLARAMGGTVTLQSEVGTGSVFTVTLPVAQGQRQVA